jgi:biphenyl-2,3-diol 1,2-dioxygenase
MNPPELAKLSHVAITTPDLPTSLSFFTDILGLDLVETGPDGAVYLRAWGEHEHHSLVLMDGPAGIDHIAWQTRRPDDVAAFAARLSAAGVDVHKIAPATELGQGEAIRFLTPTHHPFEILHDIDRTPAPEALRSRLRSQPARARRRGISPRRLDHVNVTDTQVSDGMSWMSDQLGFRLREYITAGRRGMVSAWASVTSQVHDLALTSDLGGRPGRLHHIAYELDSREELMQAADLLREEGIPIEMGPGVHGVAHSMFCYFREPGSGHRIELYAGSYHIHDPNWVPVEWTAAEIQEALIWWGPEYRPGTGHSFDETSPCLAEAVPALP